MINAAELDNINRVTSKADPTKASSQTDLASKTLSGNLDQFLKLLTTQLKNQDPTSPTDTNALTQQIASLSQVEQQINTNKKLEELVTAYSATQYNSVVSYIGKHVEAVGDVANLEGGKATFVYYLPKEAQSNNITVTDANGTTVYTGSASLDAGRNEFVWNGKNNLGIDQPSGTYKIAFDAKDPSGADIKPVSYISGTVTSIDSVGGQVYASIGEISLLLSRITSISQPKISTPATNG